MAILTIIATPIGNLGDISPRGKNALGEMDIICCEDTRHTGQLLNLLEIPRKARLVANHEYNENQMASAIVKWLDSGQKVGICSDAGYPLMSDPGYPAVAAAIAAGHEIDVIPGASAIPLAIICSGLPPSSYIFKGFAPKKSGQRHSFLEEDADSRHTMVFYESPLRICSFLEEAMQVFGDRKAAVCLELTKQFQRTIRGTISEIIKHFANESIKGEAVIVIAGKQKEKNIHTNIYKEDCK